MSGGIHITLVVFGLGSRNKLLNFHTKAFDKHLGRRHVETIRVLVLN